MNNKPTKLALFDFDGTVSPGDSILPYLLWCIRVGEAPCRQLLRAVGGYLWMRIHPETVVRTKEITLSFLKGKTQEELDALARRFWRERLVKGLFPQALEEMKRLKQDGYTILFVSASPDCYMRVLPEFVPADGVLATICMPDEKGCFSGRVGQNCRGENKVPRVEKWLQENDLIIERAASRGYGDSGGDRWLLGMTGHPVLVNPQKKLKEAFPQGEIVRWGRA